MTSVRATYRLQFRNGFTFRSAADVAPYLRRLGISHVYASPVFTAQSGSTHGYDVTDCNAFDPALGGEEGFRAMRAALEAEGLGLILDIVPNHMAASTQNGWWHDLLRHGEASPYARFFDIDWQRYDGRVLLPVLGDSYGTVLGQGGLSVVSEKGEPEIAYYDKRFPLSPETVGNLDVEATKTPEGMHRLLEAQHYRLAHWRMASDALNYRRFFDINDLVALRMEDPQVFEQAHRLVFDLVRAGAIDGLRLDHIDGLRDPTGYLKRLRQTVSNLRRDPFYIVVEKILEGNEKLRSDWPVEGTTGYEFGRRVTALQVHQDGYAALDKAYRAFTGDHRTYHGIAEQSKRFILGLSFATELNTLARRAYEIAQQDPVTRDVSEPALRRALAEVLVAFPQYRTYITEEGISPEDREVLRRVELAAEDEIGAESQEELRYVMQLLRGETADGFAFAMAFQQVSGPLTAKALEDTAFYRFVPLIALNEVGAEPAGPEVTPALFHEANQERAAHWPHCMLTTSSHDTKRGEDTRARIAVLAEIPDLFAEQASRWWALNAPFRRPLGSRLVPHPKEIWLYYQMLLGIWPLDREPDLASLRERMRGFMSKALREAKEYTRWTDPTKAHEDAMFAFIDATLDPERSGGFIAGISGLAQRIAAAGAVNGLSQLVLKLTAPGVPDTYQGTEWWDQSMVDPDNRRPVDFKARAEALEDLEGGAPSALPDWRSGRVKQAIMARLLAFRAEQADLFAKGNYMPLQVEGSHARHVIAYARVHGGQALVIAATRHPLSLASELNEPLIPAGLWDDTRIVLPGALAETQSWRDLLTGASVEPSAELPLRTLMNALPVAALASP
ncbi:malto-oligosyltrehalose synthase [Rhodoligotrophos defluvii]|uniref:malto-oligosyltrehalose synthase n=1 Tax=Rhodoligotrophos defluvii TaxID=2561934 RepID=UPI0010C95C18|nr:malto-oligosyltrehalose synthase [Rhodoligotrophos defluvii]